MLNEIIPHGGRAGDEPRLDARHARERDSDGRRNLGHAEKDPEAARQLGEHLGGNLRLCYEKLVSLQLVGEQELDLVDAWLADLKLISGRR